jgi:hypothetical protein
VTALERVGLAFQQPDSLSSIQLRNDGVQAFDATGTGRVDQLIE